MISHFALIILGFSMAILFNGIYGTIFGIQLFSMFQLVVITIWITFLYYITKHILHKTVHEDIKL